MCTLDHDTLAAAVGREGAGSKGDRKPRNLEAGSVYINRYFPAGLEAPAGAFKRSGFGSVDGAEAMRQFTRIKNVVIGLD